MCLLDLTKGVDTVSYEILLHKLAKYGITGNAFTSYLSNGVQFVKYNNSVSQSKHIYIGIPQGTILGPILFLLYINDLKNSNDDSILIQYADDSSLENHSDNIQTLNSKMQASLDHAAIWLRQNRLVVNASNSNVLL